MTAKIVKQLKLAMQIFNLGKMCFLRHTDFLKILIKFLNYAMYQSQTAFFCSTLIKSLLYIMIKNTILNFMSLFCNYMFVQEQFSKY